MTGRNAGCLFSVCFEPQRKTYGRSTAATSVVQCKAKVLRTHMH